MPDVDERDVFVQLTYNLIQICLAGGEAGDDDDGPYPWLSDCLRVCCCWVTLVQLEQNTGLPELRKVWFLQMRRYFGSSSLGGDGKSGLAEGVPCKWLALSSNWGLDSRHHCHKLPAPVPLRMLRQFCRLPWGNVVAIFVAHVQGGYGVHSLGFRRCRLVYDAACRHWDSCVLLATHLASWTSFWGRSYIHIPDSPVTMFHWYMSQYLLRISSWAGSAPGLFGPFVMDDEVLWAGDITLNYNAEAIYYNAAVANHMEAFLPYFRAILDFMPEARRMASELYPQCRDSLAFPAHILPNGVRAAGVGGGDLAQKQIGLFAAVPFILYWRYSGSLKFAESSLPFLAGVARFWDRNAIFSRALMGIYMTETTVLRRYASLMAICSQIQQPFGSGPVPSAKLLRNCGGGVTGFCPLFRKLVGPSFMLQTGSRKVECVSVHVLNVSLQCKGRILRAKRPFKKGDLVFEEPPLHIVVADESNEAFKVITRVCETREDVAYKPLWYWAAFSSLTADDLRTPPKVGCLQPVSRDQQKQLLCLYHEPVLEASAAVACMVAELGLTVPSAKVEELLRLWILNCFEHSETPEGYSAYFVSSFMSHSCRPNAIWHEGADALHVVRARMDISKGDEICISYLSEDALMFSASHRKRSLKKTKLFDCSCERCDEHTAAGTQPVDLCRGFRCPHCGGHVFPPLQSAAIRAEGLARTSCPTCTRNVGEHAAGMLDTEKQLRLRLQSLDQACGTTPVEELLTEEDARQLEEIVGDQACGALGPQHWLCERLGAYMAPWYDSQGQADQALKWLERRLGCQRQMFPWPNASRAWTMQKCSRLLLRRYKALTDKQHSGKRHDASMQRRMLARAAFLQEEAVQNLQVLFGETHRYTVRACKKLKRVRALLDRGRLRLRSGSNVAELLNAESLETRQRWRTMAGRIAPYATEVVDGQEVIADFYGGETKHGLELRLHSGGSVAWGGLFAAFPLGTVHQRSDKGALDLVHRSLVHCGSMNICDMGARFFKQWPGGKQGNSFPHVFAAAARVGWRPEAALKDWEAYLTNTSDPKCRLHNNGMVLGCGGTGLENVGGAAFASELLLQMSAGVLQVFPSLPLGMAASFYLRAPGPVLVAASRMASGFVTELKMQLPTLETDLDMGPTVVRTDFLVQSPWPDSEILVDGQIAQVRSGVFHVGLSEGRIHEIRPAETIKTQLSAVLAGVQ
ncbi:ASHR1 [Symbiodinium natans]|uniref:ASHR1 protein n=1 Tax=Symbiodinium natans TaxID=878477 RepID=A0A812US10_9DINO|nr:ASHR1 [Symbiodinium natans]